MGEFREVAEEERRVPNHLSKVLLHGSPGVATLWVVNLDVDGSDATKT